MSVRGNWNAGDVRTLVLFSGLVLMVGLLVWPSFVGRVHYARTRAELRAIRDAARGAELSSVGKLFTTLARVVGPAVVNVTSKRRLVLVADEIAALRSGGGLIGATDEVVGSGVLVDSAGVVVTNYHVVARGDSIEVALADGRRFPARLAGADAATDLAVLRIDAADLPAASWGDSDTVEVGEMVWAFGSPFGLDRTLTYGIVSGVGRRGVTDNPLQEFLQTDASINPGNSGGPLVDAQGRVIAINTAIANPQSANNVGFAIPVANARPIIDDLRLGRPAAFLGVSTVTVTPAVARERDLATGTGALVTRVSPGSAAATAGLREGDVIVSIGGEPVNEASDVQALVRGRRPGNTVEVGVARGGEMLTLRATLTERPTA